MKESTSIEQRKIPEYVIYLFLWLIFLVIPFITNDYNRQGGFLRICYDWLRMLPFIIVFILNNFWLLPAFLFKSKRIIYFSTLLAVIGSVSLSFLVIDPIIHKNDPKILEQRKLQDPHYGREEMNPLGMVPGNNPAITPEILSPGRNKGNMQGREIPVANKSVLLIINTVLISLLVAGFNTAIAVTNRWFENEQARKEIEQEHMRSELAFLQSQISPHFFMNTLNNIHSLIEGDQKLAQNAVLKLSELMRYLLYESGRGTTTLQKEIDFIKSYVELMELRVDKSIMVSLDLPEKITNISLPPLLFISFIENAFKHGVSYREPSSLLFRLSQEPGSVSFYSSNTVSKFRIANVPEHHGGLGLENIRKRLDMLYGSKYDLQIEKTEHNFIVKLTIPT
jgi:LytS/YehU family sensor histidine kinase